MKYVTLVKYVMLVLVSGFLIAGGFWLGKNKGLNLVVVDTNKIIHQTAESLARKNLKPEQVQIQITKFKDDLQKSLCDYALLNKILVLPAQSLFGDVVDKTDAFIQFYNEEGVAS